MPQDVFADLDELLTEASLATDQADSPEAVAAARAARRARRRRRGIIAAVVLLVIAGLTGGYAGWALTAPLDEPVAAASAPPVRPGGVAEIPLPTWGAAAISVTGGEEYLGDSASGIWMRSGADDPRKIASLTKLVTALVILEKYPLAGTDDPGPTITFGKAAHDLYDAYYVRGATIAPMPTGTTMSLNDALTTMLIPSASNYADALATWAFGSRWGFTQAAERWLDANGLAATTIVEPTGLDPRNVSTQTDLIALGKIAAAHPVIARISATSQDSVAGPGTLFNTNILLGSAGITGLKTGNLGPGTFSLIYTSTLDVGAEEPLTVVGVVLDGPSRAAVNESALAALEGIRAGFREVPLADARQKVGEYTTAWGASVDLVTAERASLFTWSDTPIAVEIETRDPADYRDGEVVGTLTWTAGPHTVSVPLEISGEIAPPSAWWRLTRPFR
jgi:D-alanyl-D-alanine carboxypeptidase (penicillin-binding protein 5/6)